MYVTQQFKNFDILVEYFTPDDDFMLQVLITFKVDTKECPKGSSTS